MTAGSGISGDRRFAVNMQPGLLRGRRPVLE
jgi:hypothetical protein